MIMGSVGLLLSGGCYELRPTGGVVPEVGMPAAFDINDAGRLALGGTMGPEIGQVEGVLMQRDNDEYVVGVTLVRFLRGGDQVWRGEKVRLKSSYVSTTYEKKFSPGRTAVLSGAVVAIIAAVAKQSLFPGGGPSDQTLPPDSVTTVRIPIR
ncbi:MAG: hypothetical protein V4550_08680 [Gemmatimonadota bacterium]